MYFMALMLNNVFHSVLSLFQNSSLIYLRYCGDETESDDEPIENNSTNILELIQQRANKKRINRKGVYFFYILNSSTNG